MSKSKKQTITEIIIKELPENYFGSSDIEKIIFKIWYTGRTGTGLRLTEEGKKAFADANITYYEYLLDVSKLSDKKITCPFYLGIKELRKKQPYIVVYDSRVAMMINLYGSIAEFLELYKI